MATPHPSSPSRADPIRSFGRFELRRLLGKSAGAMLWRVFDPQLGDEVMLTLPRIQPADAAALEHWLDDVRFAARLDHPNLAAVAETGSHNHWPFVVVSRRAVVTLPEWLEAHPGPALDQIAGWLCDMLRGLAFAHEAGVAHLDLQLHSVLIDERGDAVVMALGTAGAATRRALEAAPGSGGMSVDADQLRLQRAAAASDVLACGLLLHRLLAGQPALDEPDTTAATARMAPAGRDPVRLPWTTPLPVPEALRAIANRCTSSQERLRYQNARTLIGALGGWRASQVDDDGGPVAVLLGRLASIGHLPALPGLAARVARITGADNQRTGDMAEQALQDMALSFELLRTLNTAQVQGTQVAGDPPVLTLGRIVSLIGVDGVRQAAGRLRAWPGPLDATAAAALAATIERVRLAAHTAQALRPAGYDPQVVYLITVLQNLGRLMLRYHFADEAEQIGQLTQAAPADAGLSTRTGGPGAEHHPGLSENAAAFAVLGVDVDALGTAVAQHWGLGAEVLHMIRRPAPDAPVRRPDSDADILRSVASAANEAVDATGLLPPARRGAALALVAQRHGRALGITVRDVHEALQAAREAIRDGAAAAPAGITRPADAPEPEPDVGVAAAAAASASAAADLVAAR